MRDLVTGWITFRAAWMCALLTTSVALAAPGSRAWIPDLTATADAVVVGPVQATAAGGEITATINVERALKGSIGHGTVIVVTWPDLSNGAYHPIPTMGCFFSSVPPLVHGRFCLRPMGR